MSLEKGQVKTLHLKVQFQTPFCYFYIGVFFKKESDFLLPCSRALTAATTFIISGSFEVHHCSAQRGKVLFF